MKEQDFIKKINKNVCFVANFEKTFVFDKVADQLSLTDANIKIFWIVVNSKLYSYLKTKNKTPNILYLPKDIESSNENNKVEDCNVNEIVNYDRFLSLDSNGGIDYLNKIKKHIYSFLKNNNISLVFGEATWGHELLISRICNYHQELSCQYLSPQIVRLPQDRFSFFKNESENITREDFIDYQSLDYPSIVLEKQEYIDKIAKEVRNSVSLAQRLKRIKKFITKENIFKNDPTTLNKFVRRFEIGFRDELNKTVYRFVKKHKLVDLPPLKKYLYTLHVQPEASIDVLGRYYNCQYTNILQLWKNLPEGYLLMVKEHRTGIGNRSCFFYKKISKLQNVFLISENEDPHVLIQNSEAVFTVSGTIAYEAALLNKSSFTFAPVFFNNLINCHKINLEDLINCKNLSLLIKEKSKENNEKMDLSLFSKFLYHHTYKGSWAPESLETFSEQNIKLLAFSVLSLINSDK